MVKVHGLMVAGPGFVPLLDAIVGSRARRGAPSILGSRSNVVRNQAGYLARPTTKSPETQIYCTNHRSGAFPGLRVRTVVRGERASRSIVNRTTALWSIWVVASLILAGSGSEPFSHKTWARKVDESREDSGPSKAPQYLFNQPRWTLPSTNGRKRT